MRMCYFKHCKINSQVPGHGTAWYQQSFQWDTTLGDRTITPEKRHPRDLKNESYHECTAFSIVSTRDSYCIADPHLQTLEGEPDVALDHKLNTWDWK